MLTVALLCAMMCMAGYFFMPPQDCPTRFGLFFPSPNLWGIPAMWGEVINVAVIGLCAPAVFLINKHFSLLKSSLPFWALFYLPLVCSVIPVSGHLSANILLLPAVLAIFVALFNSYRKPNATKHVFFIATCIGIGAIWEYAFIPFIVASIVSGFIMKSMRFREILAMLMGLAAPYWVLVGFGIINVADFNLPEPQNIFTSPLAPGVFPVLAGTGVAAACALLLSMYNGMLLYAGNTQIRCYNNVVNVFGLTSALSIMFDVGNIHAYIGVLSLWVALQIANLFTLRSLHKPIWIFWLIQIIIFSYSLILMITAD